MQGPRSNFRSARGLNLILFDVVTSAQSLLHPKSSPEVNNAISCLHQHGDLGWLAIVGKSMPLFVFFSYDNVPFGS